ncbi:MAG: CoA ester lyase [Coxiellaceae bacterium]|nr:CoA ester lyase [Coxiellaceae bacterium]
MLNPFQAIASVLFTPGTQPQRFAKAQAAGAHGVMLDLEDAVGDNDKVVARDTICEYIDSYQPQPHFMCGMRINPLSTPFGVGDLARLSECRQMPQLLALPKVESPDEVRSAAELEIPLLVMIESELGLRRAEEILAASERVEVLFFGGYDFAADLGAQCDWQSMLMIRSQLVLLARRFDCALWDVPYINLEDKNEVALNEECESLKAMGFTGKMAIHPKHIATINEVFMPNTAEVADAQAILRAMQQSDGNACRHNGKMLDQPLIRSAERIIAMNEMRNNQ